MYSELEQMVAQDMVNAGYDPENELDIQDYWSYNLPKDKDTRRKRIVKRYGYLGADGLDWVRDEISGKYLLG